MIWAFLALSPLVLFGLLAATSTGSPHLAAMRALLWFALASLIGAEGLGAFAAISPITIRVYWLAVTVASGGLLAFRLRQGHAICTGKPQLLCSAPYGLWIALILIITLFIAVTVVPNNWDSMTYHLSRIEHWLQNRSLAFYPVHEHQQNDFGPMAEIIMLQWRAVIGSDLLAALVQWLAMAGSLMGVALITSRLEGPPRAQLLSMLFCATLPIGILQSTSTKNNYVVAFFFISFVERVIAARRTFEPIAVVEAALAIAMAILAQPIALIWGFPFGVWFTLPLIRQPRRAAAVLGLFVTVALLPCLGHYGRVVRAYGTPVAPIAKMINSASFGFGQTMDSLLLHSASQIAVPADRVNALIMSTINQISGALGWSEHRADTVLYYTPVRLPDASDEVTAGNPLHFGIAVASLIAVVWWFVRGGARPLGLYSLCCIASYLLFVSVIRWNPWVTRYHLPVLLAVSPVVGIVGTEFRRIQPLVKFLALVLCVSSWPFLVGIPHRQLWPHTYLFDDPVKIMFALRPNMLAPYKSVIGHIRDERCRQIGLLPLDDFHLDPWEFPYWYMLRDQMANGGRIEDVFPEQPPVPYALGQFYPAPSSRAYPLGHFHPGCIVVMKPGEPLQPFAYDGAQWTEAYRSGPIALYEKSVGNQSIPQ
jgi:hypothetical protein